MFSHDLTCPYCGHEQDVCNDDGFGIEQNVTWTDTCEKCKKHFIFVSEHIIEYYPDKADCLNGDIEHKWEVEKRIIPLRNNTKMQCAFCKDVRNATLEELEEIKKL